MKNGFSRVAALAACLVAPFATPVVAESSLKSYLPDRLILLTATHHADAKIDFETFTPGLIGVWEHDNLAFTAGGFSNSFGDFSPTVGGALSFYKREMFDVGLFANLSWYPDTSQIDSPLGDHVVPMGGAYMRAGHFFVQAFPNTGNAASSVVSVGLSIPLK